MNINLNITTNGGDDTLCGVVCMFLDDNRCNLFDAYLDRHTTIKRRIVIKRKRCKKCLLLAGLGVSK